MIGSGCRIFFGSKFSRKQEEAIAALLTKRTVEEAAQSAGIGTGTLLRWLNVPEFQKACREARRQAFGQSIARLQQASNAAATTLMKIMGETGQTRFCVARSIARRFSR